MKDNTNIKNVVAAVWSNPARLFGGEWRQTASAWEYLRGGRWNQRGAVRLWLHPDGEGITIHFNHGASSAGDATGTRKGIFDYYADENGAASWFDALRGLAELYGVELNLTAEQRTAIKRGELARDAAASLIEALRLNPDGPTGQYITQVRGLNLDGVHFGELTADSLERVKDSLKAHGKTYNADDLAALGLTPERAAAGYNCVIPYYCNGSIQALLYRNIKPNSTASKYWYPAGMNRGGYCDRLTGGAPVVIVEGELDAVRLIQQGVKNVIALGGAQINENLARLLHGRGITEAVYIPDSETDASGRRKTKLTTDAIRAFQAATIDGERVIKSLLVLDLPTPQGADKKTDADTYGKEHPGALPGMIEFEPVEAWAWELDRLRAEAAEREKAKRPAAAYVQEQITDIYNRTGSPFERERMRQHVGTCRDLAQYGVTPQALADVDEWNRGREYNNRIRAAAEDLNKAVEAGANPETVAGIVRRLSDAQGSNTRAEWEAQLAEPFADELQAIKNQPETLKTPWVLHYLQKDTRKPLPLETVEFYPADIAVFCAPTSHGKTAILFQAALDLVKNTGKTYLFVSCEENKRQLLERALNVYLPIETTPDGKTSTGEYCFIRGTRKRTIKAAIMGAPAPAAYGGYMGVSEHYNHLKAAILRGVELYGQNVRPRLRFVHTEASAESICNNILHYVAEWRARGVDVGGVFVDYMQLLTTDARNYSRHDELKDICKALKDCAARVELPVIIAAQLNRQVLGGGPNGGGVDNITVANIGEGADIERIAHDIYLVWQTDKTPLQPYVKPDSDKTKEPEPEPSKVCAGIRSRRLFRIDGAHGKAYLKSGYLYVEQLKARDGITGGWGLFPFDGERGTVGANDTAKMPE